MDHEHPLQDKSIARSKNTPFSSSAMDLSYLNIVQQPHRRKIGRKATKNASTPHRGLRPSQATRPNFPTTYCKSLPPRYCFRAKRSMSLQSCSSVYSTLMSMLMAAATRRSMIGSSKSTCAACATLWIAWIATRSGPSRALDFSSRYAYLMASSSLRG